MEIHILVRDDIGYTRLQIYLPFESKRTMNEDFRYYCSLHYVGMVRFFPDILFNDFIYDFYNTKNQNFGNLLNLFWFPKIEVDAIAQKYTVREFQRRFKKMGQKSLKCISEYKNTFATNFGNEYSRYA